MAQRSSVGVDAQFSAYRKLVAEYRDSVQRCEDELVLLAAAEAQLQEFAGTINGSSSPYVGGKIQAIRAELAAYNGRNSAVIIPNLTNREHQVFGLIGKGLTTPQVAEHLSLAMSTVDTYRERIKFKLNLPSGNALVREAVLWVANQAAPHESLRSGPG